MGKIYETEDAEEYLNSLSYIRPKRIGYGSNRKNQN